MSKRKTYGEILFNQFARYSPMPAYSTMTARHRKQLDTIAMCLIGAYNRRLMYDHECEQMTNGTLKRQYQRNKKDGTCTR